MRKKSVLMAVMMALSLLLPLHSEGQSRIPVKTIMDVVEVLHEELGLNFIYDSTLDLEKPYTQALPHLDKKIADRPAQLESLMDYIFGPTHLETKVNRRYIILQKKEEKVKDYVVLVAEKKDTLPESSVTAFLDHSRNSTQTGLKKIDGGNLRGGFAFMSQPDLIKNIQVLPGVSSGTEGLSGLYVHGGTGSDNLILLDGVELYSMTHLGGLFSAFNVDVIDHLDFYKSGFPARYGSKLSSVMDIKSKEGDLYEHHGLFSIGLIDGSLQADGPIVKGKTSYNIGLRRSWLDLISAPTFAIMNARNKDHEFSDARYSLTDLNLSFTHRFNEDNKLSLNIYGGGDLLQMKDRAEHVEYWEGERFTGEDSNRTRMLWGNVLASLNWKCHILDHLHLNAIAFYTHSSSMMLTAEKEWQFFSHWNNESQIYVPETADDDRKQEDRSAINDAGFKADFFWKPDRGNQVRFGTEVKAHLYRTMQESHFNREWKNGSTENFTDHHLTSKLNAAEFALYAEDEITYLKWFKVNIGLRYALFHAQQHTYNKFEPRLALKFQFCPELAFKASYSEMNQFTHKMSSQNIDLPTMAFLPSNQKVQPVHSRQFAGGFYATFPQGINLNIEGFYKTIDHLMEFKEKKLSIPALDHWEDWFAEGKGRAYGLETELSWKSPMTEVAAYYTLSWNERNIPEIWTGWFLDRHDTRHKFSLTASHRFNKKFDLYCAWHYHTGERMTLESHFLEGHQGGVPDQGGITDLYYSSPNNFQLPDYHRLDVGMNFRNTTRRGYESIWNLSLYNVYCRINTMWVVIGTNEAGKPTAQSRGIFPLLPMFSYTLKF